MLKDLGYLDESSSKFDAAMTSSVNAWLKNQGQVFGGTFTLGEFVAVPKATTVLAMDADLLYPGAQLVGGEILLRSPVGEPKFTMVVTPTQASIIPAGTAVTVHSGEQSWQ